jgi:hypothetical protein
MRPVRSWPNGPQQPLPKTVAPFESETVLSYLVRLAHANHISASQLRQYVAGSAHRRADWLAAASRQPEGVLRARLRGFASNNWSFVSQTRRCRPMCRLCMARKGIHEPVYCILPPHITVCQRHQLWIGPPAHNLSDQKTLRDKPRILAAAPIHVQLAHRYGDADILSAFRDARRFLT